MQLAPQQPSDFARHLTASWPHAGTGTPGIHAQATHPPAATVSTRIRWGRILAAIVGVGLLAFGTWNGIDAARSDAPAVDGSQSRNAGRGLLDDGPAKSTAEGNAGAATRALATPLPSTSTTPPAASPMTQPRIAPRVARPGAASGAGRTRAMAGRSAHATGVGTSRRHAAGGRQLPYTGIETWIAATLGILLLVGGIVIHVSAVRIGVTALLYRRGILLRPRDCMDLAHHQGMPRARVALSRILEGMLAEPVGREYVTLHRNSRA